MTAIKAQGPREIEISYSVWKSIVDNLNNSTWAKYYETRSNYYYVVTGHRDTVFAARATGADKADFETYYLGGSTEVATYEDAVAILIGLTSLPAPINSEGAPEVQVNPREGDKVQLYSPDFTDKTTWYTTATQNTGVTMTVDGGDNKLYHLSTPTHVVDASHGKITLETLTAPGHVVKVYDNGVEVPEHSPNSVWDSVEEDFSAYQDGYGDGYWGMDYTTGDVLFKNTPTGPVTIDYHAVVNSNFVIKPDATKSLELLAAELQFSTDLSMQDSLKFELSGKTGMDPRLNALWDGFYPAVAASGTITWDGTTTATTTDTSEVKKGQWIRLDSDGQWFEVDRVYGGDKIDILNPDTLTIPSGSTASSIANRASETLGAGNGWGALPYGVALPLQTNTYKTVMDVINEANISYPIIYKTAAPTPSWRDIRADFQIFRWDYAAQAAIKLHSSWGNEVKVWFENDLPAVGTAAIATFYCVSTNETT
jgi:hypothetical protein